MIKKGFLNKADSPALYPDTGSSEGTGGATGGSYARLMSRCQVVDTNTMQSTAPHNPHREVPKLQPQADTSAKSILSDTESREIDDLMCSLDDEWNELSNKKKHKQPVEDELSKQLTQLASVGIMLLDMLINSLYL